MEWREQAGVRWLEAELPGAKVAFTTRLGGASAAPFEGLNLGVLTGDQLDKVRDNRHRLADALALDPERFVIGRQVHSAELAQHHGPQSPSVFADPGPDPPSLDGHVVQEPALPALVFVADCLPIALSGPGGVAMLHCGWRGLAAGIVERGARAVDAAAAAVGPGIGPCCYGVGAEVFEAFSELELTGGAEPTHLDLNEIAGHLLARAGVESVEYAEQCTMCHPELFFSHRRDGERTGRQAGVAWIQNGGAENS